MKKKKLVERWWGLRSDKGLLMVWVPSQILIVPLLYPTKKKAEENIRKGLRVVRVEVKEIVKRKKRK